MRKQKINPKAKKNEYSKAKNSVLPHGQIDMRFIGHHLNLLLVAVPNDFLGEEQGMVLFVGRHDGPIIAVVDQILLESTNENGCYRIALQSAVTDGTHLLALRVRPPTVIELACLEEQWKYVFIQKDDRGEIDHVQVSVPHVAVGLLVHREIEEIVVVFAGLVDDAHEDITGESAFSPPHDVYPLGMLRTISVVRLSSPRRTFSMSIE